MNIFSNFCKNSLIKQRCRLIMSAEILNNGSKVAEDNSEDKDCETTTDVNNENEKKNQDLIDAPKRKVGMLLAFCGKNYYGLQMNRGDTSLPTIEGAFFDALVKAKVVPEICREKSQQMKYSSSSRTDKGVSTCGLVVSLKMRLNDESKDLINAHLPPDIRVLEIKRATKSFHGKNMTDARTYSYTMPTFAFASPPEATNEYRLTEDKLKHIKSILERYKGTHTFHNFTSGKKMGESSAKRYILDFWPETPFIHEALEFVTLKVKGQSFMIHQIRKMVGLLIIMVSGRATEQHFVRAFSEPLEDIPKAPGTGLILEQVHYDAYNKKFGHMHGGMDWSSSSEDALKFMKEYILPVIYKEEIENDSMRSWLDGLDNHDFTGVKAKEQWNKQLQEQKEKKELKNKTATESSHINDSTQSINEMKSEKSVIGKSSTGTVETTPQSKKNNDDIDDVPTKRLKLEQDR